MVPARTRSDNGRVSLNGETLFFYNNSDELDQTLNELEQEVLNELNQELSPDDNPNKMYNVIFSYQVKFLIPDNDNNHNIL